MDGRPLILVSGTGRCGTVAISRILTELGIECAHETAFGVKGPLTDFGIRRAESSWMAREYFADFQGIKILLFREPHGCINSLLRCGLFSGEAGGYSRFMRRLGYGHGKQEADRFYCETNQLLFPDANVLLDIKRLHEVLDPAVVSRHAYSNRGRLKQHVPVEPSTRAWDLYHMLHQSRFEGDLLSHLQ